MYRFLIFILFFLSSSYYAGTSQFRTALSGKMCASGKSSWVSATGAGWLHLATCRMPKNRRVINKNTRFEILDSANPPYKLVRRTNKQGEPFCLTNNPGGGLPVLSFQSPCISTNGNQQWNFQDLPLVKWLGTDFCWDTLGATDPNTRITLQVCDPEKKSQQFIKF